MKSIFKTVLMLFTLFSVGCSKKDDDKIDYYLSQPRDADLIGWWIHENKQGNYSIYFNFQQNGIFLVVEYEKEIYSEYIYVTYWFTEKSENKNILYKFEKHDGTLYKSIENKNLYKVINDSLWISDNLGTWDDPELTFWGVRTTAPKY
jgi:hypothetical protein